MDDNLSNDREFTASVGNVFTYAGAGAMFRVGQSLLADWGPPRIEPALSGSDFVNFDQSKPIAWSLFAGFEVRAVVRNIFLDGNSFQHSASVTKIPLAGDFYAALKSSEEYPIRGELHRSHA